MQEISVEIINIIILTLCLLILNGILFIIYKLIGKNKSWITRSIKLLNKINQNNNKLLKSIDLRKKINISSINKKINKNSNEIKKLNKHIKAFEFDSNTTPEIAFITKELQKINRTYYAAIKLLEENINKNFKVFIENNSKQYLKLKS